MQNKPTRNIHHHCNEHCSILLGITDWGETGSTSEIHHRHSFQCKHLLPTSGIYWCAWPKILLSSDHNTEF